MITVLHWRKQSNTLQQKLLNLSENELGTADCTALAEAIKHNSTITLLWITV